MAPCTEFETLCRVTTPQRFCRLSFVQEAAFLIQLHIFLLNFGIAQSQHRLRTVEVTPLRSLSLRSPAIYRPSSLASPSSRHLCRHHDTAERHFQGISLSIRWLLSIDPFSSSRPVGQRFVNVCLNGCFAETHTSPGLLSAFLAISNNNGIVCDPYQTFKLSRHSSQRKSTGSISRQQKLKIK